MGLTAEDKVQIDTQLALTQRLALGVALSLFPIAGLGSLVAIIIGIRGRKQINPSAGKFVGGGMASWCIVAGSVGLIASIPLFWLPVFHP